MNKVVYLETVNGEWKGFEYLKETEYKGYTVVVINDLCRFGVRIGGTSKAILRNELQDIIFIDSKIADMESIVEFVVLHEIGHIKLKHTSDKRYTEQEIEADQFAVYHLLKKCSKQEIANILNDLFGLIVSKTKKSKIEKSARIDAIKDLLEKINNGVV